MSLNIPDIYLTKQQQMVRALVHTIRDLVDEAGSAGVHESTIFLGFESRGIPHRVTKELVDALVSRQLLSRRANVLHILMQPQEG